MFVTLRNVAPLLGVIDRGLTLPTADFPAAPSIITHTDMNPDSMHIDVILVYVLYRWRSMADMEDGGLV